MEFDSWIEKYVRSDVCSDVVINYKDRWLVLKKLKVA